MKNGPWLRSNVQACIETPQIPLIKVDLQELHATNIIKVKIQRTPSQATSETYKMNMSTFNEGQQEEFLMLLRNFKIAIDGTGTILPSGQINDLLTILGGEILR